MKIAVVGTGYVGLVMGTCLADAGHMVTCIDNDAGKVRRMAVGHIPIYEPGLQEIFARTLAAKTLSVTTGLGNGVHDAEVIFLALPTPPNEDGSADLTAVLGVAEQLGPLLQKYTVIVDKSTVPVGTGEQVAAKVAEGTDAQFDAQFDVVSNPEFLREGRAVHDFMHPDRIVIGTVSKRAQDIMTKLYKPFVQKPEQLVYMDVRSAELTKYAANSFLAMKVSFMNEIANLSEHLGTDVEAVRRGIGLDERIGSMFLRAGIGFGGSCFPKDVLALHTTSDAAGYDFKLLDSILQINSLQKNRLVEKLNRHYPEGLQNKRFAVWGLAFKPDTDDIRESPALVMIDSLLAAGAAVCVYDPQAMDNVRRHYGEVKEINYAEDAYGAALNADALLIATEWNEFRKPDFKKLKDIMKTPAVFDGRNLYEPRDIAAAGFDYSAIGRPIGKSATDAAPAEADSTAIS